jgi:predicted lipoprotein with Yx(FWY)xxD motif
MKSLLSAVRKPSLAALILILALAGLSVAAVSAQGIGAAATPTPATVQVAMSPTLGPILVAENGMTLYLFQIDKAGVSNCTAACLMAWPAQTLTGGMPTAGMGVTGELGTLTRPDNGAVQVTVNDLPLYYFVGDKQPGDVKGQGINAFGGLWYTVKPDGTPNTAPVGQPTMAPGSYGGSTGQ